MVNERLRDSVPTTAGIGSLISIDGIAPWDFYERVRELGEVVWDHELNAWLVSSHRLVREIGRDGDLWAKEKHYIGSSLLSEEEWRVRFIGSGSSRTLMATPTGSDHNRQHRWWMQTFSGRLVRHLGDELVRPIAQEEIDRFADQGRAELYEDFAVRIAPRVIAAAMGLPWRDEDWIARLVELLRRRDVLLSLRYESQRSDSVDAQVVESGIAAVQELSAMIRPHVEERQSAEGEDYISLVWRDARTLFGPEYGVIDVIGTIISALTGGAKTVAAATANLLYLLMTEPGLESRVRNGGPNALNNLIEESLRLFGPSQVSTQVAKRDTTLAGVSIKKGDLVLGLRHAANRDPNHHEKPGELDLNRRAPRDHTSFGTAGTRVCPGQGLARTDLATIFSVLLSRLKDLRLDPHGPPPRFSGGLTTRQWTPLHALFEIVT